MPYAFWCLTAYKTEVRNTHGEIFILTPLYFPSMMTGKMVASGWNVRFDWYFVFVRQFIHTEGTEIHIPMLTYK